jgi:glycosyltransferase involved in cell wall biosynthesis
MKVLHVCYADSEEGGAIGAYRLHRAMLARNIDSCLLVIRKRRNDDTIVTPPASVRLLVRLWNIVSRRIVSLQRTRDRGFQSLNVFPTGIHRTIKHHHPDVVQCHWINRNTISIRELAKIHAPVVLKLPDMWAFCGTEHYIPRGAAKRFSDGYTKDNRPPDSSGVDLARLVWAYKKRAWRNARFTVVTPSRWLGDLARESVLFRNSRVVTIANPIDLSVYHPVRDRRQLRIAMGLPADKALILYGSVQAETDPRKGYHHLRRALQLLQNGKPEIKGFEFLIFGTSKKKTEIVNGVTTHHLGTIRDEQELVAMYAASDVMVLPAEADNLPNTIQEATSCGTPCVGFNIGGLPDMILHRETGYLAEPFDPADLARGIAWVLANKGDKLSHKVREHAASIFNPADRVEDYMNLYTDLTGPDPSRGG